MNIKIPGFVREKDVRCDYIHVDFLHEQLDFARSVGKRLDEHREYSHAIIESGVFSDKPWHLNHLAVQDDYLMRLFFLRHAVWPPCIDDNEEGISSSFYAQYGEHVRPRPKEFGRCRLPEYTVAVVNKQ